MGGADITGYLLGTARLIVQLAAVGLGAWFLTRRLAENEDDRATLSVLFALCFLFVAVCGMLLAGILGLFRWWGFVLLWGAADLLLYAFRDRRKQEPPLASSAMPPSRPSPALCGAVAAFACYFVWHASTKILDFRYDADLLSYHLPVAIEWLRSGTIFEPFGYLIRITPYHYANSILLNAFLLSPYQVSFLGVLAPSIYMIAAVQLIYVFYYSRLSRHHAWVAAVASLLWLALPKLREFTLFRTGNDLAVALCWGWGLFFLVRVIDFPSRRRVIPFFIALGLLWGSKHSGFFYAAVLFLVATLFLWKRALLRSAPLGRLRFLLIAGLVFTLPGWFWTLRTALLHGNPFFPAAFRIPGILSWDGVYTLESLSESTVLRGFITGKLDFLAYFLSYFLREYGYVSEIMLALLALSPFLLLRSLFFRERPKRTHLLVLGLLYPLAVLLYLRTPFSLQGFHNDWAMLQHAYRFSYPAVLCSLLYFGALFSFGRRSHRIVFYVVAVAVVAADWSVLEPLLPLVGAFAILWLAAGILLRRRMRPWLVAGLVAPFVIALAFLGFWLRTMWCWNWGTYGAPTHPNVAGIDEAVDAPRPLTILYFGDAYLFPLYGPKAWNQVLYYPDDFMRWKERWGPLVAGEAEVAEPEPLGGLADEYVEALDPVSVYLLRKDPVIPAYIARKQPNQEDVFAAYLSDRQPDLAIFASMVRDRKVRIPPLVRTVLRDRESGYIPIQGNVYYTVYAPVRWVTGQSRPLPIGE